MLFDRNALPELLGPVLDDDNPPFTRGIGQGRSDHLKPLTIERNVIGLAAEIRRGVEALEYFRRRTRAKGSIGLDGNGHQPPTISRARRQVEQLDAVAAPPRVRAAADRDLPRAGRIDIGKWTNIDF